MSFLNINKHFNEEQLHFKALNFDLEANWVQIFMDLLVQRSVVNNISIFSNQKSVIFTQKSFLNINKHFKETKSYIIALNLDLKTNWAKIFMILHVLLSFVNNISIFGYQITIISSRMSFLNINEHFIEKITCRRFKSEF